MQGIQHNTIKGKVLIFFLSIAPSVLLSLVAYSITGNILSSLLLLAGVYTVHFGLHILTYLVLGKGKWDERDELLSYALIAAFLYLATGSIGWTVALLIFYLSFSLFFAAFFQQTLHGPIT